MSRYRIEQIVVMALGFFAGAALAVSIAPGDILLWVATGIVLGVFSRAFFVRDLGGELLWPPIGPRHRRQHEDQPTAVQP
jgi:hypothetical protein